MGIYRYLLAATVVLFHFGGLSWVAGRVAVFAFYCISGFLIFQVLDRVYLGERHGIPRFFLNRCVRLGPSYLLYALATLAVIRLAGSGGLVDAEGRPVLGGIDGGSADLLVNSLTFAPALYADEAVPVLEFAPRLVPQGWSIGVEISFYLLAPLVVLTTRRRTWGMWAWIGAGLVAFLAAVRAAGFDFEHFQTAVYKNAVASWFVFFLGGALYYVRRRWGQPFGLALFIPVALVWLLWLAAPDLGLGPVPSRSPSAFTRYLWITLIPAAMVALTHAGRSRELDRAAGNLCYAVYLNHFLVAALFVWGGAERYLGAAGTPAFGAAVLFGSSALAALTYLAVERPLEGVRARVRGEAVREAPAPSLRLPLQGAAVLAGVALAVVVSPPVGIVVERIAASAPEEALRLSAPFDIRWIAGLSDADRARIEEDLGLAEPRQVLRDPRLRTWSYRLRQPTTGRVRAVVTHDAVEDTARIDMELMQIVE